MDSSCVPPLSFDEVCAGLRRGDFSRLAPAFGDSSAPERAVGVVVDWLEAGPFRNGSDVLTIESPYLVTATTTTSRTLDAVCPTERSRARRSIASS
jgi:hypothetical protein